MLESFELFTEGVACAPTLHLLLPEMPNQAPSTKALRGLRAPSEKGALRLGPLQGPFQYRHARYCHP